MYTHIWKKYLPIIKILLKRSAASDQLLEMNATDFERAASNRKPASKFELDFTNARIDSLVRLPVPAKDLAAVLLEDPVVYQLFLHNNYHISMNAKCQLGIRFIPKPVKEAAAVD